MNQDSFIHERQDRWRQLDSIIATGPGPVEAAQVPGLYRAVCHDLALARQRRFDAYLVDHLNGLAIRGHQLLYRAERGSWTRAVEILSREFPRAVRREWRLVLLCCGLFYGVAALVGLGLWIEPDLAYAVIDPGEAHRIQQMYDPQAPHYLEPRSFDNDAAMLGFYIYNNVSIAFRTFASGIFAGLGSLFFLIFNGVFLGAVAALVHQAGFARQLAQFVIGHGSLELTAIILSAVAGMRLGWSFVAPGASSRGEAVRTAATAAIPIVYGVTAMLIGAAVVEAYWSSSVTLPQVTKFSVGAAGWAAVISYLVFAGRGRGSRAN